MNERIKQLVEKSYIYDKQNDSSFFNKEKFAELIIQECIFAAETHWHTPDGWGWTSGQAKAIEFIYERFGIEE